MQPFPLILKYIAAEQDTPYSGEELLFRLLHYPAFQVPPMEIARLSVELSERQFTKNKTFLRALLQEKMNAPPKDLFTPSLHEGLRRASTLLETWLAATRAMAPADWEPYLLAQDGIAAFWQMTGTGSMPGAPSIERLDPAFAGALLKRFTMNVTALNSWMRCPLEFYYKNILRIPSPQSEAAGFGSAVHHALEQLFRGMLEQAGNGRRRAFPPREAFIGFFEQYMQSHREQFTAAQFDQRLAYGREVLGNYYTASVHRFSTVVAIERMIRVVYNGVPMKGKLDKLEFDGKSVNIVDYKTGDYDRALARMQPPNEEAPNGGDYWRQAVFYKILVDNYEDKGWKAVSTSFDFIEPGETGQYRRVQLPLGPADVATVQQQIAGAWQAIQQQQFYTGCGAPHCGWCQFVTAAGLVGREALFKG